MGPADAEQQPDVDPDLTTVAGIAPEDGRLAHPATHPDGGRARSRSEAENEVVGFVCDLLAAPETAVGGVEQGVQAAATTVLRGARDARPTVRRPTVVLPASAHPAWFEAAAAVGVTPLVVAVDLDGRVPVGGLTAAITPDTVLLLVSAPSWATGAIDPVPWAAAAAAVRDVPLHVDASSGGWTMAYGERLGRLRHPWDFSVPGVSSVTVELGPDDGSADGLVAVLHRTPDVRRDLMPDAAGQGPQESARAWEPAGVALADAAETCREVGHDTFARLAADALDAVRDLCLAVADVPGVSVAASPDATTLVLRAGAAADPFTLADTLHEQGWSAQPVLGVGHTPLLRLPVTPAMADHVDDVVEAIASASSAAQRRGRAQVDPTLDRLLAELDPDQPSVYSTQLLLGAAAALDEHPGSGARRSAVNLLLHAADGTSRDALLRAYREAGRRPLRRGTPRLTEQE
ncbi:MAG: hypothetical protein CMH83_18250 [Nocardioides sp.]|nr:hypothetical protein [Nocardioides sp.]